MMSNIVLENFRKVVDGEIVLTGSKSISNRVLIIRALCEDYFEIENLSKSDDTKILEKLLESESSELDAHHAGTTYRFMTSYLSVSDGEKELTGSSRMLERPIGALVDALRDLGADIKYERLDGFPPLKIKGNRKLRGGRVAVQADISSQFLSSLLLVAPTFAEGLELELIGDMVSRPYLEMTLQIMEYFGVSHNWNDNVISVRNQSYKARDFYVEADWSAASYYYSIAALSDSAKIVLHGLEEKSLQGDSVIVKIGHEFGVSTSFEDRKIIIKKDKYVKAPAFFEYDFLNCPDIAQTVMVLCGGLGTQTLFSGLKTLHIKETDRIGAMQTELQKVNVFLSKLPKKFSIKSDKTFYMQEGKAESNEMPSFNTYQDHRMAMALTPLGMIFPITVEEKEVVSKSYPNFWEDITALMGE